MTTQPTVTTMDHRTAIALELYKWIGGEGNNRTLVDCEVIAAGIEDALAKAGFGIVRRIAEETKGPPPDVNELNRRRAAARQRYDLLGRANTQSDPESQLKQDAAYRLAHDAFLAAEKSYHEAVSALTTDELRELVRG